MANDIAVLILAAGKGTRLKSSLAKVLHRAGGRALVEHVVRACAPLQARVVAVVGHQAEEVRALVEPLGGQCVVQEPQNGTGHAVIVAREALAGARMVMVLPGDAPLIQTTTLHALLRKHMDGQAAATILSANVANPAGYGRIIRREDGSVSAIVEDKALLPSQRGINEINSSIYCFDVQKLWPCLDQLRPDNTHRELYLTDAIALLDQRGERVLAQVAPDAQEVLGCNTRAELAGVDRIFRERKRRALMDAGVTMFLPETTLVDAEVEIGADTVIEPGVQLLGRTKIGAGCVIGTGSVINESTLGDGVTVKPHCVVNTSRLAGGVVIGPFAHLRQENDLKHGSRVGNFVEVKKATLGEGAKAMHLAYLGDATVGRSSNIGAGTITCNYDGVRKNPTQIGERVFVGSGTELVAPVRIGDGAYIAAGSTITEDVPADALGIARARQATKEGWAAERRSRVASDKVIVPGAAKSEKAKLEMRKSKPQTPGRRARKHPPKRRSRR
jgi:bifunctional UDP-N-acetylglucosamine pyrophosphorylase/glucosamine-1-phosphate N-acetyltransferase